MADLRKMIEDLSKIAEQVFLKFGEHRPLYDLILKDNSHQLMIADVDIADKDYPALIRDAFKRMEVQAYVFINEAWMLRTDKNVSKEDREYLENRRIYAHPNRQEALLFTAEDKNSTLTATRSIIRDKDNKATLGELVFLKSGVSKGRLVSLLCDPMPNANIPPWNLQ